MDVQRSHKEHMVTLGKRSGREVGLIPSLQRFVPRLYGDFGGFIVVAYENLIHRAKKQARVEANFSHPDVVLMLQLCMPSTCDSE